ncbi:hypothetical protein [Nocardioides sp.]
MSRKVESLLRRLEKHRSQRKFDKELESASPSLRREYRAAQRGWDS